MSSSGGVPSRSSALSAAGSGPAVATTISFTVTAGFDVSFLKNGNALLELRDVMAGKLSLPADGIGNYIRSKAPDNPQAARVAGWLDKLDGVEFKPSMKLGKDHKVWVIDYSVGEDGIALTVKVAKRPDRVAKAKTKAKAQVAAVSE